MQSEYDKLETVNKLPTSAVIALGALGYSPLQSAGQGLVLQEGGGGGEHGGRREYAPQLLSLGSGTIDRVVEVFSILLLKRVPPVD